MKKNKGFLMLESLVALVITMLGVTCFSMIILDGNHLEQKIEEQTDRALAKHMLRRYKLKRIKIHDQIYSTNS